MDDQTQGQNQETTNQQNFMHATHSVLTNVVHATSGVAEEIIHAAGRIGVTLSDEVFNVVGTIVGSATETVGSIFQGRRPVRRSRDEDTKQDRSQDSTDS